MVRSVFSGQPDEGIFEIECFYGEVVARDSGPSQTQADLLGRQEGAELAAPAQHGGVAQVAVRRQHRVVRTAERVAAEGAQQFFDGHLHENAPVVHDDAVVDEPLHVLDDVRGEKDGLALGPGKVAQVVDEEAPVARVEPHREVVEHQQVGILREDQPEGHLRTLPARHAGDALPGRHLQLLHQRIVGVAVPGGIEGGIEALDLPDRHELVLHVPFDEQADPPPRQGRHRADVLAEDAAFARLRFEVAAQDIDRRGLARAVLAQQPEDPALRDVERKVFIDGAPSVTVCQVTAFDNGFHMRVVFRSAETAAGRGYLRPARCRRGRGAPWGP